MKGILASCKHYFGSTNLYDVFNIDKDATDYEVRKAYHKLSLRVHPDKVTEEYKLEATEKFKIVGKIHSILSNKEQRAFYDKKCGWDDDKVYCDDSYSDDDDDNDDSATDEDEYDVDDYSDEEDDDCDEEEDDDDSDEEEEDYDEEDNSYEDDDDEEAKDDDYNDTFGINSVTPDPIDHYRKSREELSKLKQAYLDSQGDMDIICCRKLFSKPDDKPRFREAIQKMIDNKEVPVFEAFINEPIIQKNKRRRMDP